RSLRPCCSCSSPPALPFFLSVSRPPRHLHSFPTRRSSDLPPRFPPSLVPPGAPARLRTPPPGTSRSAGGRLPGSPPAAAADRERSEEHTSELQSRENLVCRLLLEKKKKKKNTREKQDRLKP